MLRARSEGEGRPRRVGDASVASHGKSVGQDDSAGWIAARGGLRGHVTFAEVSQMHLGATLPHPASIYHSHFALDPPSALPNSSIVSSVTD